MKLSISTLKEEGVFQASKWVKTQVLLSGSEMEALFLGLKDFSIFPLTGISSGEEIGKPLFLETYRSWIENLKKGILPDEKDLRKLLACCFTNDLNSLWLQEVGLQKRIVKLRKPVLQVQAHFFTYSQLDQVFRPMSMGIDKIFWGLQFSWPQLVQDPKTLEFSKIKREGFFKLFEQEIRKISTPTTFIVNGEKKATSIRLGKSCFSWISNHPELKKQKIKVYERI